uniref:Uncharacterized protein n=1 Tax=Solanum lycopersicum TaxID=4081 RepID=K4DE32_SOLLC
MEAFPIYFATSPIACSYFVFPLISHQIWFFLIHSFYWKQRMKYNRFLHFRSTCFSFFLLLTPPWVVSNVLHFPYFMGTTSTYSLVIKLQPKIYDHITLTICNSFIPSVCSEILVIVIRLPELRDLSVETSMNNHHFFDGFSTSHSYFFHTSIYLVIVWGVDKLIPVDVYLPGCPPKQEAVIDAISKLLKKISRELYEYRIRSQQANWCFTNNHKFHVRRSIRMGDYDQRVHYQPPSTLDIPMERVFK